VKLFLGFKRLKDTLVTKRPTGRTMAFTSYLRRDFGFPAALQRNFICWCYLTSNLLWCWERRLYYTSEGIRLKGLRKSCRVICTHWVMSQTYNSPFDLRIIMKLFKNVHVPCSKTSQNIYSNRCTIVRYNNVKTHEKPTTCFGLFRPSSGRYATGKILRIYDITSHYCIFLFFNASLKMTEKARNTYEVYHMYVIVSNYRAVVDIYMCRYEIIFSVFT
jgi:hypothetical protein